MSYRLLKFIAPPAIAVAQCNKELSKYSDASFSEIFHEFQNNFHDRPWTTILQKKGVETQVIVPNIEILQKKWAEENHLHQYKSQLEIIKNQIKDFSPDIILYEDTESYCFRSFRDQIRKFIDPHVKTVGWRSSANIDVSQYTDLDLVLTSLPDFVDLFNNNGIPAVLISDAFNSEKLTLADNVTRDIDFSFIGSMGLPHGTFSTRTGLILHLIGKTPLHVWSDYSLQLSNQRWMWKNLIKYRCYSMIPFFHRINSYSRDQVPKFKYDYRELQKYYSMGKKYRSRIHNSIYGNGYYKIMARSRMTLNCHIDIAGNHSVNIRLFDATGMGACLITEEKSEIKKFFKPDDEVLCYKNPENCKEIVSDLMEDPDRVAEVAKKGQIRTLRDHTYENRTESIHQYLIELLDNNYANIY